jgi:hypothetical protein
MPCNYPIASTAQDMPAEHAERRHQPTSSSPVTARAPLRQPATGQDRPPTAQFRIPVDYNRARFRHALFHHAPRRAGCSLTRGGSASKKPQTLTADRLIAIIQCFPKFLRQISGPPPCGWREQPGNQLNRVRRWNLASPERRRSPPFWHFWSLSQLLRACSRRMAPTWWAARRAARLLRDCSGRRARSIAGAEM